MNCNGELTLRSFLEILLQVSKSGCLLSRFYKLEEIGVLHILAKLCIAPISINKAGGNE